MALLKNGNKQAKGGKRSGAGRKPKAITVLKRKLAEEKRDDAEYAFGLFVAFMQSNDTDARLRIECAKEVLDRVLGKPSQSVALAYSNMTDEQLRHFVADAIGIAGAGDSGSQTARADPERAGGDGG